MSDPYVGKLTYFRVYSGTIKAGDRVLNTTTGKTERIGRILQMHANHREERDEISAGDIAAGVGLKSTTTGDTLAAEAPPLVLEPMGSGVLAGYPVVDVKVELIDGSYHDVDSSERAFKIAGSMAFKEAMKRAKPKLLEPMMAVEVTTPEDYVGDVMGNLSSRRGRVENMAPVGNAQVIKASVPLSEMFGYATDLRSMSQGRADFTMQFDRYDEVPASIATEITEQGSGSSSK